MQHGDRGGAIWACLSQPKEVVARNAPIAVANFVQHAYLHATAYRLLPQCADYVLAVEEEPAVRGGGGLIAAVAGHLRGWAAFSRRSPDFEASAAIRAEVDPLAVGGPAGAVLIGWLRRDRADLSSFGADDVDVAVAMGVGIEHDAHAIRRPARAADSDTREIRDLHLIGPVGVGDPDIAGARLLGSPDDLLTVRRKLRFSVETRGAEQQLARQC